MGITLLVIGYLISLVGGIMLLIEAFRVSVAWGLASLFIPFASFVFIVKYWEVSRRPFFTSLASLPFIVVGLGLVIAQAPSAEAIAAQQEIESASRERVEASAAIPLALQVPRSNPSAPTRSEGGNPPRSSSATSDVEQRQARQQPPVIRIEQVYADAETRTWYAADCESRPQNAYRVAKSIAERQGFKPAICQ